MIWGLTRHGCGRSSYVMRRCSFALLTACSMFSFKVSLARRALSSPSSTTSFAFSKPSSAMRQPPSMMSESPVSLTASARASKSERNLSMSRMPACAFASSVSRVGNASLYLLSTVSTSIRARRRPAPINSPETCEHDSRMASKVKYAPLTVASSFKLP